MLRIIDYYIIKKFLGTFFYSIALIISISIVFDITENIDDFISKDVPIKAIAFDYYLNFIPYFANLFIALFTFIAVIYFTSKMASRTEIIAILSNGISFKRLMVPYMLSATIIAIFSFLLGAYVIPPTNKQRVEFRNTYINSQEYETGTNIHQQLEPGVYAFMTAYNASTDVGYNFTLERFVNHKLVSKLSADYVRWNPKNNKWTINNYVIRNIDGYKETLIKGDVIDSTLNMKPEDYRVVLNVVETMSLTQLNNQIKDFKQRGVNTTTYELEKHRRIAGPMAAFVMTIIGASLASRKVKGGIGMHLGLGMLISFSYILFMQISTVFAVSGLVSPALAMWIPNIIFGGVAAVIYYWRIKV